MFKIYSTWSSPSLGRLNPIAQQQHLLNTLSKTAKSPKNSIFSSAPLYIKLWHLTTRVTCLTLINSALRGDMNRIKAASPSLCHLELCCSSFFKKKFNQTLTYKQDKHPCEIPFSQFSITKYQYSLEFKPHSSNNVCVVQEGMFDIFSFTVYCLLMWLNVQVNAKYVWSSQTFLYYPDTSETFKSKWWTY